MSPVEALTQIRALCDDAERNLFRWPHDHGLSPAAVNEIHAVLDAVSVGATPAQEEVRSRDEYGARPLLGVGVGDDTWPIEGATPAQGIDRDANASPIELRMLGNTREGHR